MYNWLKEKLVEIRRIGDKILLIKLVLGEETINIISTYIPQIELEESIKQKIELF
jgi:hypothetical protein